METWRQDYPDEFERMSRNGAECTPEKESMGTRLAPREPPMLDATTPTG